MEQNQLAPRFHHPGVCFLYLGRHQSHDLYYSFDTFEPTVIARFGSLFHQAISGIPRSYGGDEALTQARFKAQALGARPYDLQEAFAFVTAEAPPAVLDELEMHLRHSAMGRALSLCHELQGCSHLVTLMQALRLTYLAQAPLQSTRYHVKAALTEVRQAYRWMAYFSEAVVPEQDLSHAILTAFSQLLTSPELEALAVRVVNSAKMADAAIALDVL
jgi:hypothetical protein